MRVVEAMASWNVPMNGPVLMITFNFNFKVIYFLAKTSMQIYNYKEELLLLLNLNFILNLR
jgi:hypothetical protein